MSGKRVVKRPKKFSDSVDPELQNATRKAPYVKVLFKDDQEEQIFGSLLTDELLDIDTDEPLRFEELTVGMEVAALWKGNNHYAADIIELYNGQGMETYEQENSTDLDEHRFQSGGKGKQTEEKKKNVGASKKSKKAETKSNPKIKQRSSIGKADGGNTSDEVLEVVKLKKKEIIAAKNKQKHAQAAAAQIMAASLFTKENFSLGISEKTATSSGTDLDLCKSTEENPAQQDLETPFDTTSMDQQPTDTLKNQSTTIEPLQTIATSNTEPILKFTESLTEKPATTSEFQPLSTTSKENSAFIYARGAFSNLPGPQFPFHYSPTMTKDLYLPPPVNWNYQQPMFPPVNQEYQFLHSHNIHYPIPMWKNHLGMTNPTATASSEEHLQQNTSGPALLDISNFTPGADIEAGNGEHTDMDVESNTSNLFSSSMNVLAGDSSDEESIAPSQVSSVTSESVPINVSSACHIEPGSECADCLRKDKEIADLKRQIRDMETAGQSGQVEEDSNISLVKKQHKPKTRPDIEFAEHIILQENQEPPPEFERLAPGAKVAVKPLWLHSMLATLKRKRAKKQKKADKKGLALPADSNIEIIKRLIDGFYDPWDLVKGGGSSSYRDDPVFQSLGLYAEHELKMGSTEFTRAWNTKMASARQMLKRNQQGKEDSSKKKGSAKEKEVSLKKKSNDKENKK